MNKPLFFSLVVLIIIGVFGWFLIARVPHTSIEQILPHSTVETLPDVVWPDTVTTEKVSRSAFPKSAKYWKSDADGQKNFLEAEGEYPTNTPFAENVKKQVIENAEAFVVGDVTDLPDDWQQSAGWSASYVVTATNGKKLLTYLLESWKFTGGAHGNTQYESHTFDMNGKEYALKDLFIPGSDYLGVLSRYAKKDLSTPDEDGTVLYDPTNEMFAEGLDPTDDNFKTFIIDDTGLGIQFQDYQVGPHSIGTPAIEIPYTDPELHAILRPELFDF